MQNSSWIKTIPRLLILSAILSSFVTYSNGQFAIEWQKSAGGSSADESKSVCTTYDGGIVIAGISHSVDGDAIGNISGGQVWVVKLSESGDTIWQKNHGTSNMIDRAESISETFDHGFILSVYFYSGTNSRGQILKLDSLGNYEWGQELSGLSGGSGNDAVQTSDSSYIYGGCYGVFGAGNYNFQVVKIDSANGIKWTESYGGTEDDYCYSVTELENGNIIAVGNTYSVDGDVTGNHGSGDIWIIKLDSLGQIIWQNCYGGTSREIGYDLIKTSDGGFIVTGRTESPNGQVTGFHGSVDIWVFKIDSIGALLWNRCLGGTSDEYGTSLAISTLGEIAVAGYTDSHDGDILENYGQYDGFVAILDSAGNLQDQITLGSTQVDYINDILYESDGNLIVTGYTEGNDIDVSGFHGLRDTWTVKLSRNFNKITGNTFADLNSNLIHDAGEPSCVNLKISELNTGRNAFSNNSGNYKLTVFDTAAFEVTPVNNNPYFVINPLSHNSVFNGFYEVDSLNDFALQPIGAFNDLCIAMTPTGPFRPGFNGSYNINIINAGTTTITNGMVTLYTDSNLLYVSSTNTPTLVTNDSITFNIAPLNPFEENQFTVTLLVNSGTGIGTVISSVAKVEPIPGDSNPLCNFDSSDIAATGSFDPNDILVDRELLYTFDFPNPPLLEYTVRFQNTGNDTAFSVVLISNFDSNLDPASLIISTSSHQVQMNYEEFSRKLKFTFENILLPDDNTNEPGSHGFVRYLVRPLNNLQVGDSIKNKAAIYFDFNAPVITNTAITEVVLPTGLNEWPGANSRLVVFPNPAIGEITITGYSLTGGNVLLKIMDVLGNEVYSGTVTTTSFKFQTGNLSRGVYFVQSGNENTKFVTQ